MPHRTVAVMLSASLSLSLLLTTGAAAAGKARRTGPKLREPAKVKAIVNAITAEAVTSWKKTRQWPREQSDFAKTMPASLDRGDLINALTHRVHPSVAIDGYVKWQLLSYMPKPADLTPSETGRLVGAMPMLIAQPSTVPLGGTGHPGTQNGWIFVGRQTTFVSDLTPIPGAIGFDPTLSIVQQGSVLAVDGVVVKPGDPRYLDAVIQNQNAQLNQLRTIIQRLNAPAVNFRNQLMGMAPAERGMRVAAMLEDTEHRLRAGEPSSRWAVLSLTRQAEALPSSVPRGVRNQLNNKARELMKVRAKVADHVEARAGKIVLRHKMVMMTPTEFADLSASLRP